jgi:hypothetical protein
MAYIVPIGFCRAVNRNNNNILEHRGGRELAKLQTQKLLAIEKLGKRS